MSRLFSGCIALLAIGCPAEQPVVERKVEATAKPEPEATAKPEPEAKVPADTAPTGRVIAGPLPIEEMLGHAPAEVEAKLGDPLGKGESRTNCVRYVPDRMWFRCAHARQRYADPTGKFAAIGVEFEDGKASALAFEGLAAEGAFDPGQALTHVGLELPGEPKVEEPEPGTKVYSWFNGAARLRIHGRQYRVQVSSVDGGWARSKVELVLNDPLNADELARKTQ